MIQKTEPKKIPWDSLSPGLQIIVLQWMIEGIHMMIRAFVKEKAYQALVNSIHKKEKFDPKALWDSLNATNQAHFEHTKTAVELLEKMTDAAWDKKDRADPAPDPAPEPTEQPKKKKKR